MVEVNHRRVKVNLAQVRKEAPLLEEDSEQGDLMTEGEDREEVLS